MATDQAVDDLIAPLQQSVTSGLGHFQRLAAGGKIRMGTWGPREVLCHLVWWHQATVEGMESVRSGGAPYRIYAATEEMNARAVGRLAGQTMHQLAEQVEQFQTRLVTAVHALPTLSTTVFVHADGSEDSAQTRLEAITRDWHTCIENLQAL